MHIKLTNGIPEKYSIGQLRRDNPQVSFPKNIPDATLVEYDVFPLKATPQPEVDYTKNVAEGTPVKQRVRNPDGTFVPDNPETPQNEAWEWVQVWDVTDATDEEVEQRTEQQAAQVRAERNQRLSDSDWTQVADAPVDQQAWAAYRQELRNVPQQSGFPWNVTWPQTP
jgi:hypothetical protein